jgi:hypothetical protein
MALRLVRSTSSMLRVRSRARICWLNAGWVISRRAAEVKLFRQDKEQT